MLKNLFLFLNVLVAIGLTITYTTPFIDPLSYKKIPIVGLFYPLLLLVNFIFSAFWLFTTRKKYVLLSLVPILLGIQHVNTIIGLPTSSDRINQQSAIVSVGSYNIKDFDNIAWKDDSFQPGAIKKLHQQFADLDFLCLQEANYDTDKIFKKELQFPHHHKVKGTRIFSRNPFVNMGTIPFESKYNSCTWVDIKVGKRIIRLYSVHLESNHITAETQQITQRNGIGWKSRLLMLKDMFRQDAYRNRLLVEQTQLVVQHIEESPYPVIICGDFNDSPLSYIYRKFAGILKDGFSDKGNGFSFSYRGNIPFLRIDYIFSSPSLSFHDYQTLRNVTYSDHYPVVARIGVE